MYRGALTSCIDMIYVAQFVFYGQLIVRSQASNCATKRRLKRQCFMNLYACYRSNPIVPLCMHLLLSDGFLCQHTQCMYTSIGVCLCAVLYCRLRALLAELPW